MRTRRARSAIRCLLHKLMLRSGGLSEARSPSVRKSFLSRRISSKRRRGRWQAVLTATTSSRAQMLVGFFCCDSRSAGNGMRPPAVLSAVMETCLFCHVVKISLSAEGLVASGTGLMLRVERRSLWDAVELRETTLI